MQVDAWAFCQPDVLSGAMVAAAKIGADPSSTAARALETALLDRLDDASQEVSESAAVALGILGHEGSIEPLLALLGDDAAGRALAGGKPVTARTRAFAAYALGLVAERSGSNRTRQRAARGLVHALDERASSADLEVAAVSALGILRLAPDPQGTTSVAAEWVSRDGVARAATRAAVDPRRRELLRGHAPVALARLAEGAPDPLRGQLAGCVVGLTRNPRKLSNEALQGTALALGALADCDPGGLDGEARGALERICAAGEPWSRGYALVSLGALGGRRGSGEDADRGERAVRRFLLDQLLRGRTRTRTWAALGLGVMERARLDAGAPPDRDVREVLRSALAQRASPDEYGAYAVAVGLARDVAVGRDRAARDLVDRREHALADEIAVRREHRSRARGIASPRRSAPGDA